MKVNNYIIIYEVDKEKRASLYFTYFSQYTKLYEQIKHDKIDEKYLEEIYKKDKIFDEIDYMIYY